MVKVEARQASRNEQRGGQHIIHCCSPTQVFYYYFVDHERTNEPAGRGEVGREEQKNNRVKSDHEKEKKAIG